MCSEAVIYSRSLGILAVSIAKGVRGPQVERWEQAEQHSGPSPGGS